MFTVWSVSGVGRPYEPRAVGRGGQVQRVDGASAIHSLEGSVPGAVRPNPYRAKPEHREPKQVLFARDVMSSPVVTVMDNQPVGEVLSLMRARRFRHIPVLNEESALVGVVSDRDILAYLADRRPEGSPIKTIMISDIVAGETDTAIRDVARVMFEERLGCLPIVDGRGRVEGIVTRSDLLRAILTHAPMELWV